MIRGKTKCGFEFTINSNVGNDYELVEQLVELEENSYVLTKVVNKILGKEQTNKLKDHLRNEDGIVPTDKMINVVGEIFTIGGEMPKNS